MKDHNQCVLSQDNQKTMSTMLNGFNIEDAKILHIGGRPLNAPEGEWTCEVSVIDVNVT